MLFNPLLIYIILFCQVVPCLTEKVSIHPQSCCPSPPWHLKTDCKYTRARHIYAMCVTHTLPHYHLLRFTLSLFLTILLSLFLSISYSLSLSLTLTHKYSPPPSPSPQWSWIRPDSFYRLGSSILRAEARRHHRVESTGRSQRKGREQTSFCW